jgi:hypothetical protein
MSRTLFVLLAAAIAVMAAVAFGTLAHDGLGVARATIRIDALAGVVIIGSALIAKSRRKRSG